MISIILPTYNSKRFIEERLKTILNQTFAEWECIVVDGESTDGTVDTIISCVGSDKRFRYLNAPPKGVYNAWNIGINEAKGDFVYFATSDDTMRPDCLSELNTAISARERLGLAHCELQIIDEHGNNHPNIQWDRFLPQQYFEQYAHKTHIRKAPLAGIMYFQFNTVIHSFTQILIKKSVFDEIGLFIENMGPKADLEWGMRACLKYDMIHVPKKLATWRVHDNQLTEVESDIHTFKTVHQLQDMALKNTIISDELLNQIQVNKNSLRLLDGEILYSDFPKYKLLVDSSYRAYSRAYKKYGHLLRNRHEFKLFDQLYREITGEKPEVAIELVVD